MDIKQIKKKGICNMLKILRNRIDMGMRGYVHHTSVWGSHRNRGWYRFAERR